MPDLTPDEARLLLKLAEHRRLTLQPGEHFAAAQLRNAKLALLLGNELQITIGGADVAKRLR